MPSPGIIMKNILRKKIDKVVKELFKTEIRDYSIEIPPDDDFGDYSTNAAFALSKKLGRNPKEIADKMVETLHATSLREIEKVEVAGGGFINFFLDSSIYLKELNNILKEKGKYGSVSSKKSNIQVEFISANPTGPLTVGNGRGGFGGDVLAKVLEKSGAKVQKEYYVNDAGRQVKMILAKSVRKSLGLNIDIVEGENIYGGEYIENVSRKIKKEKGIKWIEKNFEKTGELASKIILEDLIKKDIKSFGIKFDNWMSEKSFFSSGLIDKIWKKLTKDNLVYEQDGAYWLKTSKYGDDKDRVVKTTGGEFTYIMSDMAYLYDRFSIRKFYKAIIIVGADHHGYLGRWYAAAEILGYKGKLEILVTQLVRLIRNGQEMKMSKRQGNFITLKEVVDDIGIDAARYFFISRDFNNHIDIDLDLAKEESNKNPVFYIQYASARIASVLAKIKNKKEKIKNTNKKLKISGFDKYELNLIRKLAQYPELVKEVGESYQVNKIAFYAFELAEAFHKFYDNCRIIGDDKRDERLKILKASKIVLENCLRLMGIEAKSKM